MNDNGVGIRIQYYTTNRIPDHIRILMGEVLIRGYDFLEDAYLGREERRFRKDVILRDIIFKPKTPNILLTQEQESRLKQIRDIQITDIDKNFPIPKRIGQRG